MIISKKGKAGVHEMQKRRAAVRRKRQPIYKPDYAGVYQIAVAKRIVGTVLVILLVLGIGALAAVWLAPALWSALQPSPVVLEEREQAILDRAEETGKALREDPETGLPLYEDDLNLFLINAEHPAGPDFEPELETVSGIRVDWRIAPALEMLVEDAWAEDIRVELVSGYVSYAEQKERYEAEVQRLMDAGSTKIMAYEYAKDAVLPPGTCDLQTGLCITLKGDEDFETTEICSWLESNMASYGFVFRYPVGKDRYTGEEGTKLVLRYVGPEHAPVMRRLALSLEEYIDYQA